MSQSHQLHSRLCLLMLPRLHSNEQRRPSLPLGLHLTGLSLDAGRVTSRAVHDEELICSSPTPTPMSLSEGHFTGLASAKLKRLRSRHRSVLLLLRLAPESHLAQISRPTIFAFLTSRPHCLMLAVQRSTFRKARHASSGCMAARNQQLSDIYGPGTI